MPDNSALEPKITLTDCFLFQNLIAGVDWFEICGQNDVNKVFGNLISKFLDCLKECE